MSEGWGKITRMGIWHYFINEQSLCGNHNYYIGRLYPGSEYSRGYNCHYCNTILEKINDIEILIELYLEGKLPDCINVIFIPLESQRWIMPPFNRAIVPIPVDMKRYRNEDTEIAIGYHRETRRLLIGIEGKKEGLSVQSTVHIELLDDTDLTNTEK